MAIQPVKLAGKRLYLRPLTLEDATDRYVGWLNDPEVNRFLEVRFSKQTRESVREFIRANQPVPPRFFAIVLNEGNRHIGNIKLGPSNPHHRFTDVGIVVGEKNEWGKGYATEAISLVKDYAFNVLKLNKLTAGAYALNAGSWKAFENAGFAREGVSARKFWCQGEYVDEVLVGANNLNPPKGDFQ